MQPQVKKAIRKHIVVGLVSLLIVLGFWLSRIELVADARIWRALGDTAFVLLALTLLIGPLAKLWPMKFAKIIAWRRETGIWTALIAIGHNIALQFLWFQGNFMILLGYAYINGNYVHVNPSFGLANIIGLLAILMLTILLATSSNYAVNLLGNKAWKFLHMSAYTVFYLVSVHIIYHLFMHGSWQNNWFSIPFVIIALTVILLQTLAFVKVVSIDKKKMV